MNSDSPARTTSRVTDGPGAENRTAPEPVATGRMYDAAMERGAVHSRRSLQRYLAVLITP